jgi:Flp pilus assembly protein TadB
VMDRTLIIVVWVFAVLRSVVSIARLVLLLLLCHYKQNFRYCRRSRQMVRQHAAVDWVPAAITSSHNLARDTPPDWTGHLGASRRLRSNGSYCQKT